MIWLSYDRAWGGSFDTIYKQQFIDNFALDENELQPIKFQGQSLDIETGLHYNRFRYYDSDVGMFISRDPIELLGGFNVFAYAPNPVGWIDPWGLSSDCVRPSKKNPTPNLSNLKFEKIPEKNPLIGVDLNNMDRTQISALLNNSKGVSYKGGSKDGRFMQWEYDSNKATAVRIDPPDKVTQYDHIHLYDTASNSLDITGKVVPSTSSVAHIKIK